MLVASYIVDIDLALELKCVLDQPNMTKLALFYYYYYYMVMGRQLKLIEPLENAL